jgi:penicillin-binding protein 1A
MVAAHDTDNIPQIPGIELHPVQVAEQARLAAVLAQSQSANPETPAPPPAESVKDMSTATRQALEKISALLKDARRLTPIDSAPDRAETPLAPAADASPKPSLASATNADGQPNPAITSPDSAQSQTSLSAGTDGDAPPPH